MKNTLIIPLLLITFWSFGQSSKEIIGKPIKIGNLYVAQYDFQEQMSWDDAKSACRSLGKGWRLPTKSELNILYKNKYKIGGFVNSLYWSSSPAVDYDKWWQDFSTGWSYYSLLSNYYYVRAVKTL